MEHLAAHMENNHRHIFIRVISNGELPQYRAQYFLTKFQRNKKVCAKCKALLLG